tara:strand:+ start:3713 stop:3904 length:192 start_codon:yes stop_codon:yes gene_type:complete
MYELINSLTWYDITFMVVLTYAIGAYFIINRLLKKWSFALDGWKESAENNAKLIALFKEHQKR